MCLLTFLPPGVMPNTDALLTGAYFNDDGHGFAIVTGDRIIVQRGMNADAMVEQFRTCRQQHPDGPALFHSRFSTHGESTIDNCHPFPIGGDSRTVLAHNGILPREVQPQEKDPRSDTRITAEQFLPAFGSLRSRQARLRFQRWMRPHNKIVILTVDRRFKQRAYILNERSGIWENNIWYSNDGYQPPPPGRWEPSAHPRWDWLAQGRLRRPLDRCGYCGAILDLADSECRYCGWCADCGELPEQCFCYAPAALDKKIGAVGKD